MSFISTLAKGTAKVWSKSTRVAKVLPECLLGDNSHIIGNALRKTKGSIWDKGKAAFRAVEKDIAIKSAKGGGFFARTAKNLVNLPKHLANSAKVGVRAAKIAGKSTVWGGFKGVMKGLGKKMPFIGAALTIGLEAPNIYRAFKDEGFAAGMKEVGGAAVELGCMATGAAIGSAICPGVGTLIGSIVGGIAGCFIRGETHTEKKEREAELPKYSNEDKQELKEYGLNDEQIEECRQNGLTMDDIRKEVEKQLQEAGYTDETQGATTAQTSTQTTNNNTDAGTTTCNTPSQTSTTAQQTQTTYPQVTTTTGGTGAGIASIDPIFTTPIQYVSPYGGNNSSIFSNPTNPFFTGNYTNQLTNYTDPFYYRQNYGYLA